MTPIGEDEVMTLHQQVMDAMNEPAATSMPGQDSVARMHHSLMREHAEPHDGFEPVPVWVYAVFAFVLFWGGMYIGTNAADFRRDVFDRTDLASVRPAPSANAVEAPDPDPLTVADLMKIGVGKYQNICQSCHQVHGNGDPGQGVPPLNGSEWVVGIEASSARLSRILLYGMHELVTVRGRSYNGQMPAHGITFRDYEIAAVLTYVRNSWENKADPDDKKPALTAAVVKAARMKEGSRKANGSAPVTAAELLTLKLDYSDFVSSTADGITTK